MSFNKVKKGPVSLTSSLTVAGNTTISGNLNLASNTTFVNGISITDGNTSTSVKGTTLGIDQISYRRVGDKYLLTYRLGTKNGQVGTSTDGYIYSLPPGIEFDTTDSKNPNITSTLSQVYSSGKYLIPAKGSIIAATFVWSTLLFIVPYSSTKFRLLASVNNGALNTITFQSKDWFAMNQEYNIVFEFEMWVKQ